MSDALNLPAELRERAGKGASRALRREGRVPAVIYGGKEEPTPIHVEEKLLVQQLGTGRYIHQRHYHHWHYNYVSSSFHHKYSPEIVILAAILLVI